jgi:D-serine deaminase-like pyridoxal phosphate-dependent protein
MGKRKVLFPDLDTPSILVDMDRLETNINAMANMTARVGIKLRPYTKVHKSTFISELQIKAGAIGVSISKVGEARVYAEAGIKDIMIIHPFYGDHKFAALKNVLSNAKISCVVDSIKGAKGISEVGLAVGQKIPVLLKIDTGLKRFGVLPGDPTLKMAKDLTQIPGIELVGILEHISAFGQPSAEDVATATFEACSVISSTAKMLRKEGIQIKDVAVGSTPTAAPSCRYAPYFPEITELHPGAYVFGDWMYINSFSMTEDDCAGSILVTVVSRPGLDRACIDAGTKTFGADPLLFMAARSGGFDSWKPIFGSVKGRPDIKLTRLTEEVGILSLGYPNKGVSIGDRLEIIPNHISLAVNMKDKIFGVRNGSIEREIPILCRGIDY